LIAPNLVFSFPPIPRHSQQLAVGRAHVLPGLLVLGRGGEGGDIGGRVAGVTSGLPRGTAIGAGNLRSEDINAAPDSHLNGRFKINLPDSSQLTPVVLAVNWS
jgi:hypothetical protein